MFFCDIPTLHTKKINQAASLNYSGDAHQKKPRTSQIKLNTLIYYIKRKKCIAEFSHQIYDGAKVAPRPFNFRLKNSNQRKDIQLR